jgi:hypothetical protein
MAGSQIPRLPAGSGVLRLRGTVGLEYWSGIQIGSMIDEYECIK